MEVQFLSLGKNLEKGSRSKMSEKNQIVKNNAILDELTAASKK